MSQKLLRLGPSGPYASLGPILAGDGLSCIKKLAQHKNSAAIALSGTPVQVVEAVDVVIPDQETLDRTFILVGCAIEGELDAAGVGLVTFGIYTPDVGSWATMAVKAGRGFSDGAVSPTIYFRKNWWLLKSSQNIAYGPPLAVGTNQIRLSVDVAGGATSGQVQGSDVELIVAQLEGGAIMDRVLTYP